MYLSNTNEKIEIVLAGTVTTNQLEWTASYQDITSAGMTLPQSSSQGLTNSTTAVDMVAAPAASTNRQVVYISVYNDDTVDATVKIRKDVGGTEYIYVNQALRAGETLEWSREIGWTINGTVTNATHKFTVFTSNGTWTKPSGLKAAYVFCVGGGGGGGSGARNAAGTNRFGGGGGAGGGTSWQYFAADQLGATVAVTVGLGGTGGAGVTADNTNGAGGTNGGLTSFGTLILALGGGGGGGGTTAAGGSGGAQLGTNSTIIAYGPYSFNGTSGPNGQTTGTSNGGAGLSTNGGSNGGAAGGAGSGISSANVSATSAGSGGSIYRNGLVITGPASGASPNGVNNQSNFLHMNSTLTSGTGLGTGGAGGYPAFKDGGNGGYAAGGGGGSGVLNGTTSGKGGNGGDGLCIVLEIY